VLLFNALGVRSAATAPASVIFASHWPRTRSTDFACPCPRPLILDGLRARSAPLRPSRPEAILATFRRMGVLGAESSARDERDECGEDRVGPLVEVVRSSRRVWYANILGEEEIPLGGEGAEVGVSGIVHYCWFGCQGRVSSSTVWGFTVKFRSSAC
jgi:hypothetical protein